MQFFFCLAEVLTVCYIKHQFNHFLAFDQAQVKNEFSLPCATNLLTKQNTCWLRWL